MHENILSFLNCKFGSVTYHGHPNKLTELHLWRRKFCKVGYPKGTQKPDIQMQTQTFLTWDFLNSFCMLLFWSEKKSKPAGYTRTLYSQTGKNMKWAETFVCCWLLIFEVVYQDHLTQLLPFAWDFVAKGQQLVWGQVGKTMNSEL